MNPGSFPGSFIKPPRESHPAFPEGGIDAWFRGDDVVTDSGRITQFNDKSGSQNHLVEVSESGATYNDFLAGGQPGAVFASGSSQYYKITGFVPGTDSTVLYYARNTRTSLDNQVDYIINAQETGGSFNGPQVWTFNDFVDNDQPIVKGNANGGTTTAYKNGETGTLTLNANEWHAGVVTFDGITAFTQTDTFVGANPAGTLFADMELMELVILDHVADAGEIAAWQTYCEARYIPFNGSSLLAWLKNNTGQTLDTTGGTTTVSYWKDASGNGNHFEQSTKSKQGLSQNGGVKFDGTDDEMSIVSGKLGLLRNKPGAGIYILANAANSETKFWFFSTVNGSGSTLRYSIQALNTDKMRQHQRREDGGSSFAANYTNAFTKSVNFLFNSFVDYVADDAKLYKNGVQDTDGAAGSTGTFSDTDSGEIFVGSSGGADYSTVKILEIIITDGPDNREAIQDYLLAAFGLS